MVQWWTEFCFIVFSKNIPSYLEVLKMGLANPKVRKNIICSFCNEKVVFLILVFSNTLLWLLGEQSGPEPYTSPDNEAELFKPVSKSCKGAPQRVIKAMNKFRYLLVYNLALVLKIILRFDFAWPSNSNIFGKLLLLYYYHVN